MTAIYREISFLSRCNKCIGNAFLLVDLVVHKFIPRCYQTTVEFILCFAHIYLMSCMNFTNQYIFVVHVFKMYNYIEMNINESPFHICFVEKQLAN